ARPPTRLRFAPHPSPPAARYARRELAPSYARARPTAWGMPLVVGSVTAGDEVRRGETPRAPPHRERGLSDLSEHRRQGAGGLIAELVAEAPPVPFIQANLARVREVMFEGAAEPDRRLRIQDHEVALGVQMERAIVEVRRTDDSDAIIGD